MKRPNEETPAQIVRRVREALDMSQEELGIAIGGRDRKTVRSWEKGTAEPKWKDMQAIFSLEKRRKRNG